MSTRCLQCKMLGLTEEEEVTGLCSYCLEEVEDEQDFLEGKTCNPNEPEECESCQ